MIYTVKGKPIPEARRVGQWWGVSDGMGGWYNPKRDAWIAAPYTFASEEETIELAHKLATEGPG